MYDFIYEKPVDLATALASLKADPECKPLAGGQTFIPVLKQRLNKPSKVVDLARLGLSGITVTPSLVTIGAMTTHGEIALSGDIQKTLPALAHMASMIGDWQVRHRGTMGGSIANNDPSACYPSALLATGGTVTTDRRSIKADDYFQGMFTTALEDGELVTSVSFPVPQRAAYTKFRNPASRYAMVGVFVAKFADGVRVAITGASQSGVFRHKAYEAALTADFTPAAIAHIKTPSDGLNSDIHASAEYRAHLIGVMTKRAVEAA